MNSKTPDLFSGAFVCFPLKIEHVGGSDSKTPEFVSGRFGVHNPAPLGGVMFTIPLVLAVLRRAFKTIRPIITFIYHIADYKRNLFTYIYGIYHQLHFLYIF